MDLRGVFHCAVILHSVHPSASSLPGTVKISFLVKDLYLHTRPLGRCGMYLGVPWSTRTFPALHVLHKANPTDAGLAWLAGESP